MKKLTFWGRDEKDERLLVECMLGLKTATCTPKVWCSSSEDVGEVGDEIQVFTKLGQLACKILITEVYDIKFGDIKGEIGEKIARGENSTLDEYIKDHIFSWEKDLLNDGIILDENTLIVVEHFKLIESYIDYNSLGHKVKVF
ncbi:ASCH domain-containing protein [Bacillus sp. 31A1R]|uniref:ASCH domain-containing protein n=1 Tax=Robertmurraya mangrovi TaxID=3098077 RepID=A0ABU5IYM3_9BACI|nr:ASCH domain-containing protein [Bacillus sp. 31A1R]MDZ5472254.1 ASCH domain-containing protein [Bacillus sp. 31A1R]